jgi:anti-sigma factor (TIGR02949 family)
MQGLAALEPKSCSEIERWLHMAVDGELSHEDRPEVDEHLAGCPRCQAELGLIEKTRAGLAQAANEDQAPAALVGKIQGQARSARRRSRVSVLAAAIPAAIAIAALGVGGLALYRTSAAPALTAAAARSTLEPFVAQAVKTHRLEVPVDVASADPRRVARFLRQRIGHNLEVPRLDHLGLNLAGGRVVSVTERAGAQLVYQGALGRRLSVVALPDPDRVLGSAKVLFDGRVSEVPVRVYRRGEVAYGLVGDAADNVTDAVQALFAR